MKKTVQLFGIIAMLTVLTACGYGEGKKAETQAGYEPEQSVSILSVDENSAECRNTESEASLGYEYEKDIIRYGEMSEEFSFRKDVERTQTDHAVYYFETSVNEQERQACITATERTLSFIGGTLPDIEIAVFSPQTFDSIAILNGRLYVSTQSWDTAEYVAGVLLAGYSEWGNYGLAYGYANHLCKEAGLDYREADGFMPMSNTELYDLNLPCFDERFSSPEDVEAAKNDASLFADDYLSAHSDTEFLELLSDSGTVEGIERANEVLEAFYAENGVECSLTQIRYQYGGMTLDYAAACEYASFYLEKDWQDRVWDMNPMVSEHFLHEDYGEVRAFFECNVRQMGQYQEWFGFDSYNNDLPVIFANSRRKPVASLYYGDTHTIWLETVLSLSHEYIHSLMFVNCDDWGPRWKGEGFARYYDRLYNDYAYDYWNHCLNSDDEEDFYNPREKSCVNAYMEHIGRPIDMKIQTDYHDWLDLLTYANGWDDPNLTYESGASFLGYLINRYGEEAAIQYVCSYHEYNVQWRKSYEELVQDWNDYINENYSWCDTESIQ